MKYSENALNILTAKSFKGIGRGWLVKNLKGGEDMDTIVSLLNNKIEVTTTVTEFENIKKF